MKLATRTAPPEQKKRAGRRPLSRAAVFLLLCGLLLAAIVLAAGFGSVSIPFSTIVQILLNHTRLFHFVQTWDSTTELIILQERMPGVIGAAMVGAGLAISGTLFQGILRNPLADPFLIGTSSGAALGAAISFILPFADFYGSFLPLTQVLAFTGALAAVLIVYAIARTDGRTPVVTLLLAGVVINAVMVALQTLILTISPSGTRFGIPALFNWLSGGISITDWWPVQVVGVIIVVGSIGALWMSGILDTFALGEEGAAHLGLRVEIYKFLIVVLASLITAAAVSISGLIGFVGLVTPHVMRLLLGPNHLPLLPASALGGAIFLVLTDLLARTVTAPTVLPIGIFTALVGAPFFLFLLRRSKREYQW